MRGDIGLKREARHAHLLDLALGVRHLGHEHIDKNERVTVRGQGMCAGAPDPACTAGDNGHRPAVRRHAQPSYALVPVVCRQY